MSLLVARSIFEELHTSARFLSIASRRLPDPLAAVTAGVLLRSVEKRISRTLLQRNDTGTRCRTLISYTANSKMAKKPFHDLFG